MMTATISERSQQEWGFERPAPGGIVVGVDGSTESIEALNIAAALARRKRQCLHAVTVIPAFPSYHITTGPDSSSEHVNRLRLQLKCAELGVIMNALQAEKSWSHEVLIGRPARSLADLADARCAELIVLGRHQHGILDRITGGETTMQVMRLSSIPVLAVGSRVDAPKTVLAAIDFSPASVTAAKTAVALLGTSGTLYLAYVEPPAELLPEGFALPSEARFPGDVVLWFRRLQEELGTHPGILIETSVLTGRPVPCILEFAERVGADLIAAGSHGHSRLERFLLGSVSTGLVRNANCAVLVAPPHPQSLS
jgi:nucleotide-binding universal stress UspA family protein